jgi:type I restriction enzyme S subunit
MNTLPFSKLVEINPRVKIEKSKEYPFVEMGIVEPSRRYVRTEHNRIFQNGGAKFLSGDTLFARITPCLENGKIAQYQGVGDEAGFGSTEFFVFRARTGVSDPGYVYYLAKSDIIRKPAEKSMSGASGRQRADLNSIVDLEVPYPPLPTQRKIAAILSAYDDLIENNLRRIKILEEMAQNLYREWFIKFRFPDHQHTRFTDSPLGRIPEGWEVKALGKLADQIRDGVNPDSVDPGTPYFGLEHLPRKSITLADWGFAGEVHSTKLLFKKGDILFGKIRPYFHKVGVAPLSGVCSSDTIVIRPISTDLFGLILGCTSSAEFVEHATATSQGTKMPRANWDVLVKYQVPMPRQPIFGQFNEFMNDIVNQLHNFVFRNQNLRRTRDLLLPRLISGEVDVSELEIILPEEAAV